MILTRAVEPGEVVMPGSGLLTMARMSDLTITVYIPEDRYGEISIGQTADVTVDSFLAKILQPRLFTFLVRLNSLRAMCRLLKGARQLSLPSN